MPICLIGVPICLGTEMSHTATATGAEVSSIPLLSSLNSSVFHALTYNSLSFPMTIFFKLSIQYMKKI